MHMQSKITMEISLISEVKLQDYYYCMSPQTRGSIANDLFQKKKHCWRNIS